tara:strand:+ start:17 stop:127 length:111 start_codon:yes stop_codon:yes gene_type:complete
MVVNTSITRVYKSYFLGFLSPDNLRSYSVIEERRVD